MAFTTVAGLVTACAGLSLASVKRAKSYRPKQINDADLPLLYCRLPQATREISTYTYGQGLKYATIEIVILAAMMNLDKQENNDALTVTLIDELSNALETAAVDLGMDKYSITTDEDTIGSGAAPVQAIIATVEVSG